MKLLLLTALGRFSVIRAHAEVSATLEVDVSKPGPLLPSNFLGLMTEEINHVYDGGLYAELIQSEERYNVATARCLCGGT